MTIAFSSFVVCFTLKKNTFTCIIVCYDTAAELLLVDAAVSTATSQYWAGQKSGVVYRPDRQSRMENLNSSNSDFLNRLPGVLWKMLMAS